MLHTLLMHSQGVSSLMGELKGQTPPPGDLPPDPAWGEPQCTGNRALHGWGLTRELDQTRSWRESHAEGCACCMAEAQSSSREAGSRAVVCPTQKSLGLASCPVRSLYTEPVEGRTSSHGE